MTSEVIIDGVRYIPAKEALANRRDVARALLLDFWGNVETEEELDKIISKPHIKVLVHDWDAGGVTLKNFLDTLASITPNNIKE